VEIHNVVFLYHATADIGTIFCVNEKVPCWEKKNVVENTDLSKLFFGREMEYATSVKMFGNQLNQDTTTLIH